MPFYDPVIFSYGRFRTSDLRLTWTRWWRRSARSSRTTPKPRTRSLENRPSSGLAQSPLKCCYWSSFNEYFLFDHPHTSSFFIFEMTDGRCATHSMRHRLVKRICHLSVEHMMRDGLGSKRFSSKFDLNISAGCKKYKSHQNWLC